MSIADLEERIGYHFADSALLSRALTHSSVATEREAGRELRTTSDDYETLEFLGDAVLGLAVAEGVYPRAPPSPHHLGPAPQPPFVRSDGARSAGVETALLLDQAKGLEGDVVGGVDPVEASIAEILDFWIALSGCGIHGFAIQVTELLDAKDSCDLSLVAAVSDELALARHVNAVGALGDERWTRNGKVDVAGSGFLRHLDNPLARVAADDGIVHKKDIFPFKLETDRIQFAPNARRTALLIGHDEGAADVAILDEAIAIGDIQLCGHRESCVTGGVGNGDDNVGPWPALSDPLTCERMAESTTSFVNVHLVEHGVGARKVDELKDAGPVGPFCDFLVMNPAMLIDKYCIAGADLDIALVPIDVQNHAFGGTGAPGP